MATPLDDNSTNPLLQPSKLPYSAPPLDQLKAEYFLPAIKAGIAEANQQIEAIKNNKAAPTFANTIEALEFSGHTLGRVNALFDCLTGAKTSKPIEDIEDELNTLVVRHSNEVMMDAALFARVKTVYDQRTTLKLTDEQQMLLKKSYKSFVRSGALLDDKAKNELKEIKEKLSTLGTKYKNNSLKSTDAYQKVIDNESDLAGIPERACNDYKSAAEQAGLKGKWLIKLSPPPMDIFQYATNRKLREEIYRADGEVANSGAEDNHPVTLEIVRQRQRLAEIMGFKNYAAYTLDDRMAKTPETVKELLETNLSVYKPAAEKFLQGVKDYAQKVDGITDFQPWDYAYYSRRLKEETFKVDVEELRPYFDLDKVLEGMRLHAEKLFNIKLTEVTGKYPVYDPDMKTFEVTDKKTGETIGLYYADYYARAGEKRSGAWMSSFRERGLEDGENKFAIAYNVCNYTKPSKGHPTLLSLDEVTTTFHEFGHALHALLAQGNYPSLTGTSVKWDFVEAPSQLQENWVKKKEVLDTFAAHYKTGEKLPADLIKKINDMENFDAAYAGLRQTFFGLLDMKWHTTDPATIKSVEELEDSVGAKANLFKRVSGPMSVDFGHLFAGGYAAGYYGYKWAERLEADIFSEFEKNGLYDPNTSQRLRDTIYSQGGTKDEEALFEAMMGRKADPNALFRREGLLPPKDDKGAQPTKPHRP